MDPVITTLVAAVALGIAGQVVAERFQIPAILPLLLLGIALGPSGLAFFDPDALGPVLAAFIHLGVAIILFEGGLSLDPQRVAKVGAPVRNLLTIGVVITGVGSAWLAHQILGMPWSAAALFGAVMTVTGPTVIMPLLRHMIAPREVKTILLSEGLIVDPIGAVLAYMVLQWIIRAGIPLRELAVGLGSVAAAGVVLGFAAGALAKIILSSRFVSGELRNLSILALLMVCYLAAERQAHQSGVLAAVVMGVTISASELPDLVSVKAFKGQLTTLVISMLFILLAGQLDIASILDLGWGGLAVAAGLIVLVRPVSVALSIWPSHLDWRGRVMIAATAPRGIVAAAVASLAAREMAVQGLSGGSTMESLTYVAILVTGAWSTGAALALPRPLGFTRDPARRRAVLVGANPLTLELAKHLVEARRTTVIVDGVSWRLDRFRTAGISAIHGDARDSSTYEEAGVERDSLVVAATTNDELNLLVAELVRAEFGVEHPVVALQAPPDELGRRSRAWIDLLGGRSIDIPHWIRRLDNGTSQSISIDPGEREAAARLREVEQAFERDVLRLLGLRDGEPVLAVSDDRLDQLDALTVLVGDGKSAELLRASTVSAAEGGAEEVEPDPPSA